MNKKHEEERLGICRWEIHIELELIFFEALTSELGFDMRIILRLSENYSLEGFFQPLARADLELTAPTVFSKPFQKLLVMS